MIRHTFRNPALSALADLAARLKATMAVGTVLPAKQFKISVATIAAPTVFMPVSFMNDFSISSEQNVGEFEVFDFPDPITFDGNPRRTLSVRGYLATADGGQDAILDAAQSSPALDVILKMLWDGVTDGFTQQCKVRAYSGGARAGNNPDEVTFDFTPTTALGTMIGAGPLL